MLREGTAILHFMLLGIPFLHALFGVANTLGQDVSSSNLMNEGRYDGSLFGHVVDDSLSSQPMSMLLWTKRERPHSTHMYVRKVAVMISPRAQYKSILIRRETLLSRQESSAIFGPFKKY